MKGTTNAQRNAVVDSSYANNQLKLTYADGSVDTHTLASPIIIDDALSSTSTNPVQNRVVKGALDGKLGNTETAAKATADADGNTISTTYLKSATASTTYLKQTDASGTYLKKTDAASTYATQDALASAIGSVYRYKGSVAAYGNLPTSGQTTGDVYNVEAAYGNVPAGTNWAWNGTTWDALAGTVDLSPYAKAQDVANTYATQTALNNGLAAKQNTLTFDSTPTENSTNPVTSGGVYSAINATSVAFYISVTATVSQGSGDVSGILVTATPQSGGAVITATTGSTGKCTLKGVQGEVYALSYSKDGYSVSGPSEITTTELTNNVAISCYKLPTVTMTVSDASGAGLQAGRTIRMSGSGDVQTAQTNSSGVATFTAKGTGSYTFSMVDVPTGGSCADVTATLSAGTNTSLSMTISFGYGYAAVDISLSDSNPATRCSYPQTITVNGATVNNSCYGFTPASGASGSFAMNSWATHKILEGIQPVSKNGSTWKVLDTNAANWAANGSSEDYFTEFPFQWLSITKDSSRIRVIFSDKDLQPDSTFQCYAHAKGCDSYSNAQIESAVSSASRDAIMASNNNSYFANTFHIGCFGASGGASGAAIYSKKATTYATNIAYTYFWQGANARGTDYDCMSAQQWTYIQALFLLLYRSTDSQTAHSYGLANGSKDTGNAALSTTAYGMAGSASSARNAFFWIHDAWGNIYQFIGGMWNRAGSSSKLYYWLPRQANSRAFNNGWTAATTYATQASLGTDTSLTCSNSGGYISTVAGSNTGGFFPTAQGGSATTYWPDNGYVTCYSSYAYFPRVGGDYGDTTDAGLFCCSVYIYSTSSNSNGGVRLSYRGGRALA